jgi:crossover junction endodeoxyribonuclease RuvC
LRVLGVDPGMTRCGVGIVDGAPGRVLSLTHVEVVRTPSDISVGERLLALDNALRVAIERFAPDVVAVERVFAQHNVRTVMGTAQVAGLAIVAATRAGIPVALHTPSEVKAAVTGSGSAGKAQVGAMVTRLLRLPDTPKPADAADALALAICQIWRGGAQARIEAALAGVRR